MPTHETPTRITPVAASPRSSLTKSGSCSSSATQAASPTTRFARRKGKPRRELFAQRMNEQRVNDVEGGSSASLLSETSAASMIHSHVLSEQQDVWLRRAQIARAAESNLSFSTRRPRWQALHTVHDGARRTEFEYSIDDERRRMSSVRLHMSKQQTLEQAPTKVYGCVGEIDFRSSTQLTGQPPARYACFGVQTDVIEIFHVLTERWQLAKPSVILSVTGSADELDLEPILVEVFKEVVAASCLLPPASTSACRHRLHPWVGPNSR